MYSLFSLILLAAFPAFGRETCKWDGGIDAFTGEDTRRAYAGGEGGIEFWFGKGDAGTYTLNMTLLYYGLKDENVVEPVLIALKGGGAVAATPIEAVTPAFRQGSFGPETTWKFAAKLGRADMEKIAGSGAVTAVRFVAGGETRDVPIDKEKRQALVAGAAACVLGTPTAN